MNTGWVKENDKWYFYDEKGNKVKNEWQQYKNKWYYLDENGDMLYSTWKQINSKWYYFYDTGIMAAACWIKDNDRWYYVGANGGMQTGWIQLNNKWYYLTEKSNPTIGEWLGQMVSNCTKTINGKSYAFNADGSWIDNSVSAGNVSDKLVNFVKSYEGFRANKYADAAGVMTIGYGTIKPAYVALGTITEAQATQFLKEEIDEKAAQIKARLDANGVRLSQNQFDALCSFAYNCGLGALYGSTLWRNILHGVRDSTLKANFTAWSKAGGRTMKGLLNRRIEEYQIFAYGDYTRNL